jgi:hypothetical protein
MSERFKIASGIALCAVLLIGRVNGAGLTYLPFLLTADAEKTDPPKKPKSIPTFLGQWHEEAPSSEPSAADCQGQRAIPLCLQPAVGMACSGGLYRLEAAACSGASTGSASSGRPLRGLIQRIRSARRAARAGGC